MASTVSRLARAPRAALLPVALAAVALAGCGSSSSGDGDADPAAAVPARAPVYLEATVRPDGQQREDLEAALKKILRTDDPAAEVRKLVDRTGRDSKTTYADDIEPWLGKKVGLFFTAFDSASAEAQGALVVAASDTEKAFDALKEQAGGDARERTYRDVKYLVDGDTSAGVVGDYAVLGSDRGFRAVVDVVEDDAASLADDGRAKKAREAAGDEGLGSFYLTPSGLGDALSASGQAPPQTVAALRQLLARAGDGIAASMSANGQQIAAGAAAVGVPRAGQASGPSALPLGEAPQDAFLALQVRDIGGSLDRALAQVGQLAALAGQGDVDQLLGTIEQQTGIDVREDLLSWMGDGVVFAQGTTAADLGGALVVNSTNPARSRRAVGLVGRLLRQQLPPGAQLRRSSAGDAALELSLPQLRGLPLSIVADGDRFVVAIGRSALQAALDPSAKLGDGPLRDAAGRLGDGFQPSAYFSLPQVLRLAEGLGATQQPGYAQAKPYLEAFGEMIAGVKADGDVQRSKAVVGLR